MKMQVWFSEWEGQQWFSDGASIGGCISYPAEVTDDRAESSYGQPVVVINGRARGIAEMPPGELQVPDYALVVQLNALGYQAVYGRGKDDAMRVVPLTDAYDLDDNPITHWHPAAVILVY